jgi:3-deoxy-D-arabino-heptulosonate 7-phosphate (DAHP) synthase class II
LLRYRHYLVRVIQEVLSLRYERQVSWMAVVRQLAGGGYPALRTMQRWCASFGEQAGGWLKAVQEWLAQQDSRSGWLDAQGEALRVSNLEQALLVASEHLLAWGKTRWVVMADYGLEKRMEFLWLWGETQGLRRLV